MSFFNSTTRNASIQSRLGAAKKAVRNATSEALKSSQYEETLPGISLQSSPLTTREKAASPLSSNVAPDFVVRNSEITITSQNQDPNHGGNDNENQFSEATFDLGMSLFGDDIEIIEKDICSRLTKVEEDLEDIITNLARDQEHSVRTTDIAVAKDPDSELSPMGLDQEVIEKEVHELTKKINFLKRCSDARLALEEVTKLSMAVASGGPKKGGVLIETSKLLSKANEALKEAEKHVQMACLEDSDTMGTTTKVNETRFPTRDLQVADQIMNSIRVQIRRKRVDLHARASSILDSCIIITSSSISVREVASSSLASPKYEGLSDAFDTLLDLSSLDISSNSPQNIQNSKLEDALYLLSNNLSSTVFKPIISRLEKACSKGVKIPKWQIREVVNKENIGAAGLKDVRSDLLISSSSTKGSIATLEWREVPENDEASSSCEPNIEENIVSWKELLKFIQSVIVFVHERALIQRKDLCRTVGRFLFGNTSNTNSPKTPLDNVLGNLISDCSDKTQIMNRMTRLMWETCIPESSSLEVITILPEIAKELKECVDDFEKDLMERHFIDAPTSLSDYASDFERSYAEKRRSVILAEGRNLLLKNDYHNTIKVGVNVHKESKEEKALYLLNVDGENNDGLSVFLLHECAISQVASNLMDLCRKTMEAAVDPRYNGKSEYMLLPPTLYRTARELLDLFRAIIPSSYGSEISSIPRTAAVLHNDCVYFSHTLLTFGLEFRDRFSAPDGVKDSPLRQLCTFVDLVPTFREVADQTMGDMIQLQKLQLVEIVGSRITILRDALRSNESVVEWTDAETALTAGLYHLRHLSQAWKTILSHDVYGRSIGNLVDTLFMLFLDQVMKAQELSELACHFVSALFRDATRGVMELFDSSSQQEVSRFCNLWHRFIAIGKFMDLSLADINLALSEGTFRAVTGPELSRLIVAVFEDSDKRKKLLRLLASD